MAQISTRRASYDLPSTKLILVAINGEKQTPATGYLSYLFIWLVLTPPSRILRSYDGGQGYGGRKPSKENPRPSAGCPCTAGEEVGRSWVWTHRDCIDEKPLGHCAVPARDVRPIRYMVIPFATSVKVHFCLTIIM